jgi:hypothetical protein
LYSGIVTFPPLPLRLEKSPTGAADNEADATMAATIDRTMIDEIRKLAGTDARDLECKVIPPNGRCHKNLRVFPICREQPNTIAIR